LQKKIFVKKLTIHNVDLIMLVLLTNIVILPKDLLRELESALICLVPVKVATVSANVKMDFPAISIRRLAQLGSLYLKEEIVLVPLNVLLVCNVILILLMV